MKVAVSIPDDVFAEAEVLAAKLKVSRSHIYGQAVKAYVSQHLPTPVIEQLNAVIDAIGDEAESIPAISARQLRKHSDW